MTGKGFIFNQTLCVNCKACIAACSLENKFALPVRTVLTFNENGQHERAVSHLSIACNHCGIPLCMNGCPSKAYIRNAATDAVIIDQEKCLGCNYCTWNCPYDAPKFDPLKRVIGKCHLCYTLVTDGSLPACAQACPTGALKYEKFERRDSAAIPLLPEDFGIEPALRFSTPVKNIPLEIIPHDNPGKLSAAGKGNINSKADWSLVLFSFSATIAAALTIFSFFSDKGPGSLITSLLSLLPGIISLFHLGKPLRAWRAPANIRYSPLSREIICYLSFVTANFLLLFFNFPVFRLFSVFTGLILLISIDSVYYYSTGKIRTFLHSGQTFISALLIASFFTGELWSFLFMAIIKLSLSVRGLTAYRNTETEMIFFFRLAALVISSASFLTGISYPGLPVFLIFLTGELLDRIIFYIDFYPRSIKASLNNT